MIKLVLLVSNFLFAIVAGLPTHRIIDGELASSGEFPYIVSVTDDKFAHLCGGIIYNEEYVLTTATCVNGIVPSTLRVVAGQVSLINVEPNEETVPVFSVAVFDGFNPQTKLHDIALLQLSQKLTFNTDVSYIRYEELPPSDSTGTFIGWGATTSDGPYSTRLRKGSMTIPRSIGSCTGFTGEAFNINYMICAGSDSDASSPCRYDEGGPLVLTVVGEQVAVGIYSKSNNCTAPSVFTRLTSYYPWFEKIAGPQPVPTQGTGTVPASTTSSAATESTTVSPRTPTTTSTAAVPTTEITEPAEH